MMRKNVVKRQIIICCMLLEYGQEKVGGRYDVQEKRKQKKRI